MTDPVQPPVESPAPAPNDQQVSLDPAKKMSYQISTAHIQVIARALGKLPHEEMIDLFNDLNTQFGANVQAEVQKLQKPAKTASKPVVKSKRK